MIEIKRDGQNVDLKFELSVPLYEVRIFTFHWDAGSEWAAGLLASAMRTAFSDAVRAARKEEYEAGWKDAKSHKAGARRDYFTYKLVK